MHNSNQLTRIIIVGVVAIAIVFGVTSMFDSNKAMAPENAENIVARNQNESSDNATTSIKSLDKISSSSNVVNDLDVYIESTNTLPNPNDFNDSYGDLNQ